MRKPDVIIGPVNDPYLLRWHVIPRNPFFNIYLHNFKRSDDDRALHDHPWWNLSILLKGSYLEHTPKGVLKRNVGSIIGRFAKTRHRIELIDLENVWSLFLTGPRIRMWGFYCPDGWLSWPDFEAHNGCGEDHSAFPVTRR